MKLFIVGIREEPSYGDEDFSFVIADTPEEAISIYVADDFRGEASAYRESVYEVDMTVARELFYVRDTTYDCCDD